MGTAISKEEFDERDYPRFRERLEECLSELGRLLERPGFGIGPATIGAELEVFLIDGAGRPLPRNQAIRAAAADPRVTVELNRCNMELNTSPASANLSFTVSLLALPRSLRRCPRRPARSTPSRSCAPPRR